LRIENKKKATVRTVALQIFRDERKENLFWHNDNLSCAFNTRVAK